jgi:hypothetical protein
LNINLKRFALVFLLCNAVLFISGCSVSWIGAIKSLMPAIQLAISAVFSFIASLEGKTIPVSVTAAIAKIEADVTASLQNVQTILAAITSNPDATTLQKIEAVFQAIVSSMNSILAGLSITDSSTVGKITSLIGLAIAAVEAVLGLIPLAMKANTLSTTEQVHADKAATVSIKNTHKVLQQSYHAVVSNEDGKTPTQSAEVNLALAALPQTLP